jgi:hypothetical protein
VRTLLAELLGGRATARIAIEVSTATPDEQRAGDFAKKRSPRAVAREFGISCNTVKRPHRYGRWGAQASGPRPPVEDAFATRIVETVEDSQDVVSLLASCRQHDVEPLAYLRELCCTLPGWPRPVLDLPVSLPGAPRVTRVRPVRRTTLSSDSLQIFRTAWLVGSRSPFASTTSSRPAAEAATTWGICRPSARSATRRR